MKYEIDILHYLGVYKREWKKIAGVMIIGMIITVIVGFSQPVTYRSTLVALSFNEGGTGGNMGGFSSLFNLSSGGSFNDIIFSMLKSRRMRRDINERFNLKNKPDSWWKLDTYLVTGGFSVEVMGSEPNLTRDVANFSIENLEKLNKELTVSPERNLVKVLDPAERGIAIEKNVFKKVIAAGLLIFFIYTLFIFFKEYFTNLKASKKGASRG